METFQPIKVIFDPNCTLSDYVTLMKLLTSHPAISHVDHPTHNLSVAARKKRKGEP